MTTGDAPAASSHAEIWWKMNIQYYKSEGLSVYQCSWLNRLVLNVPLYYILERNDNGEVFTTRSLYLL